MPNGREVLCAIDSEKIKYRSYLITGRSGIKQVLYVHKKCCKQGKYCKTIPLAQNVVLL